MDNNNFYIKTNEQFEKIMEYIRNTYSKTDIGYQKKFIEWIVSYINEEKQKGKNIDEIKDELYNTPKNFILSILFPSITDFYYDRTSQLISKDKKLLETHIETFLKKNIDIENLSINSFYDENMSDNIQKIIETFLSSMFSDSLCKTPELINLREKYINCCSDKTFISNLATYIQQFNNSLQNRYYAKFINKIQKNPKLLCDVISKKYLDFFETSNESISFNIDNEEHSIPAKKIQIKTLRKDAFYSTDDIKNAKIFIQDEFLPSLSSNILSRLYNVLKNQSILSKFILTDIFDVFLQKIDVNNKPEYKNYKYNLCCRIKKIVEFLNKLNLLDKYNAKNNKRLDKLNIPELKYTTEELLNDLTDINKLYSLSTETLLGLSSFYSNRASKTTEELSKSMYILKKLNLFEKIYNDESFSIDNIDITDDQLIEFMSQYDFIINEIKYKIFNKYLDSTNKDIDMSEESIYNDYQNIFDANKYAYECKYPGCFHEDFEFVSNTSNSQDFLYLLKTQTAKSLVYTALKDNKKNIINWGYINDYETEYDSDKILLGFDIQSLNMPIKLHVKKEDILPLIQNITNNSIIPCYMGNNDMHTMAGHMSTQILNVVSKDRKKEILKNTKTQSMFFNHIKWLQRPLEKPDYFKSEELFYDLNTNKTIKNEIEK